MTRGEWMRAAREEAGWLQYELAEAAGVAPSTLSMIEKDISSGSLHTVMLLADVLGLTIDEYVGHFVQTPLEAPRSCKC